MDQLTKANINLHAILRNLKDLCEMDKESFDLVKDKNLTIQFIVKGGVNGSLSFENGKVSYKNGVYPCNIKLYFTSPEHLNAMFDGTKMPIPLKGFTKISFLQNEFKKLTDRLSYFLKPTDELLKNPEYFKINTYLTAYTAFFALGEIANHDTLGKVNAKRVPDGIINIFAKNGPGLHLIVKNGHIEAKQGVSDNPRAVMEFNDLKTVNDILNGKSDIYTAIGEDKFGLKGFIPMLDNLNKLLDQVPAYVQ